MERVVLCLVVVGCILVNVINAFEGKFEDRFKTYETLHASDITYHRVKRSADLKRHEKIVSFSTFGKHFKLHLQSARGLFAAEFKAVTVDATGNKQDLGIDTRDFYKGYVEGDPESQVHAHWEGNDMSVIVKTKDDIYVVEPSHSLLPKSNKFSMVSYKMSDIQEKTKEDMGKSFCGYVHPEENRDDAAADDYLTVKVNATKQESPPRRNRRQTTTKKICPVALVADYHYYQNVGQSSANTATSAMVSSFTIANDIFRTANFGNNMGTGFEMQIKEILVNTAATAVTSGNVHYNMAVASGTDWDVNTLLREFSRQDWSSVCLSHLFTYQNFANGVLGLGWIASGTAGTTGGICPVLAQGLYYNTAFSSSENSGGNRLSTLEANLVLTHEFGHNWGSPHDPASCAPSVFSGGKYIMYQYSVNGYDSNNNRFSQCSLDSMGVVLAAKKDLCFVDAQSVYCGNGIRESEEECDGGSTMLANQDACCTTSCRLRGTYVCSDYNDDCCTNCQYAAATKKCRFSGSFVSSCQEDTFCTGTSASCPAATNKPDNSVCANQGACIGGVCRSFCEKVGLIDCECADSAFVCKRCCKDSSGTCSVYDTGSGQYVDQEDGKPCSQGYCQTGECLRQIVTLNQRTWNLITSISRNGLLEFMRSNIVLTVVVITLVIYTPIVIIVLLIDWKNDKKDEDSREWHHRENDVLVREDADILIRPTYTRRRAANRGGGIASSGSMASESAVIVGTA